MAHCARRRGADLAGGGLQPSSQGILLDRFPPEKQGAAQTLFGVAALIAPVLGPTLGGWITDQYSWRWIFYINLPVGVLAFSLCALMVQDPQYLRDQRAELKKRPLRFDSIGLGLLVLTLVCWEVVLSKGQEWDWFDDAFGRIQILAALFVLGLACLIFWKTRHPSPIVNFRPLRERNFVICCIVIFCAFGVLYGSSTLRNEGGSVRTSLDQTITERRGIFNNLRLGENLDTLNPAVNEYLAQTRPGYLQQTGDPPAAQQMACAKNRSEPSTPWRWRQALPAG